MKKFKVGDRVICDGIEGVVNRVLDDSHMYPVHVEFADGVRETFTSEGKSFVGDYHSSLFYIDDNNSEEEADMKEFKAGDTVVHAGNKGVVTFVNHDVRSYPVFVEFDNGGADSFTLDGKSLISDDRPSLFHTDQTSNDADQTSFQDMSIVDILNREGYGTLVDGDKIYVGREGVVVATLIMRGKG